MSAHHVSLSFAAHDPARLASFWSGVLQRDVAADGVGLVSGDDLDLPIRFTPTAEPKNGPNQIHFDLTSTSLDDQQATVSRALERGGRHLDIGQGPDADHVVLADPEGNEFCVIEPGNNFLAGTPVIGALSSDGTQAVGYFWSQALGWPLVWDQDEETAIQSPRGGSKISWGGPPVDARTGRNRLSLDVRLVDRDVDAEVARLVSLGATGVGDVPAGVEMLDPDGNEFCVVRPR